MELWHGEWGWRDFPEKVVSMGYGLQGDGRMTEKSDWVEYVLEDDVQKTQRDQVTKSGKNIVYQMKKDVIYCE